MWLVANESSKLMTLKSRTSFKALGPIDFAIFLGNGKTCVFIFHHLAAMGAVEQVIWSWLVSLWFPIGIVSHVTNVADEGFGRNSKSRDLYKGLCLTSHD